LAASPELQGSIARLAHVHDRDEWVCSPRLRVFFGRRGNGGGGGGGHFGRRLGSLALHFGDLFFRGFVLCGLLPVGLLLGFGEAIFQDRSADVRGVQLSSLAAGRGFQWCAAVSHCSGDDLADADFAGLAVGFWVGVAW
jgi:hypothetical protein